MKKIITIVTTVLLFFTATAQKSVFGFNGGIIVAAYKSKTDGDTYSSKSKIGFTAGIVTDIALNKSVSFQPALQFTQRGGVDKETFFDADYKMTTTLNYLELPLNILFKTNSVKAKFYIGAGPTVALGISGKAKVKSGDNSSSVDLKFGSGDDDDLKGLDLGADVIAGFEFKNGITISANYNFGLSNLYIDGDKDNYFHNRYFGLRLGYMLKPKKK